MSWWSRIANVIRADRLSREIDEELQSHIEEAIKEGRDPEETRRAFGSVLRRREESRDIRLITWLDSLRADSVFGWRQLSKRKVTSAGPRRPDCGAAGRVIDLAALAVLVDASANITTSHHRP